MDRQNKSSLIEINPAEKFLFSNHSINNAACYGNLEKIRALLSKDNEQEYRENAITRETDSSGKTPLHNAIIGVAFGNDGSRQEICELLVKADVSVSGRGSIPLVNVTDADGSTALHYAAIYSQPILVKALLKLGSDPDLLNKKGESALHICCGQNSQASLLCAIDILGVRKPEDTIYSDELVQVAAECLAPRLLELLLSLGFTASVKSSKHGATPLMHVAFESDGPEAVECARLLLQYSTRTDVNSACDIGTPLVIATIRKNTNIIKTLLKNSKVELDAKDKTGSTAIQYAVGQAINDGNIECLKAILESLEPLKRQAQFDLILSKEKGESDFDKGVKAGATEFVEYIISLNANPKKSLDSKRQEKIYNAMPQVMLPLMDRSFHYEGNGVYDVDFGPITGYNTSSKLQQETKFLYYLDKFPVETQTKILTHPLTQLLLELKWKRLRLFIWSVIIFKFIWLLLYTLIIIELHAPGGVYADNDTDTDPETKYNETNCLDEKYFQGLKIFLTLGYPPKDMPCGFNQKAARWIAAFLYVFSIILILKEFGNFVLDCNKSLKHGKLKLPTGHQVLNYGKILIFVFYFVPTIPAWLKPSDFKYPNYLSYLAAFSILTAWILNTREVGRLPFKKLGLYSELLKTLLMLALEIVLFYISVFIAFALSLMILMPEKEHYKYLPTSIAKVVVMITGEIDFTKTFYDERGTRREVNFILAQIVCFVMIFPTSIILLNTLVAFTIDDVNRLIEQANTFRLFSQLEQIYFLETLIQWLNKYGLMPQLLVNIVHERNVVFKRGKTTSTMKFHKKEIAAISKELLKEIEKIRIDKKLNWDNIREQQRSLSGGFGIVSKY